MSPCRSRFLMLQRLDFFKGPHGLRRIEPLTAFRRLRAVAKNEGPSLHADELSRA